MFYVYVYRDPRPLKKNQPVYVGKGTGDRDLSHWSRGSHNKPFQDFISHLKQRGLVALCERVFETEVEAEAFAKEIELIALYGRRNTKTGTLFNLTDGGEGGSGTVKTAAHKEVDKYNSIKNWADPEYRAKTVAAQQAVQGTPKARAMKSENSTETWTNPETRQKRQQGIKRSRSADTSKAKTSAQAKAQWSDPEYAAKQTANNQEIANRAEVKAAKAAAAKALWADPEWKAKMLAARAAKRQQKVVDTPPTQ
jgi:hypothetical protein